MRKLLEGKTAIVTGASKGIGKAVAELFAQEGANVVLTARGQKILDETVAGIAEYGGTAIGVVADSTDPHTPTLVFEQAIRTFGQADRSGVRRALPRQRHGGRGHGTGPAGRQRGIPISRPSAARQPPARPPVGLTGTAVTERLNERGGHFRVKGDRDSATWTASELKRIDAADELHVQPQRRDGARRPPTTIWVIRHRDGLYVRSYRGDSGSWYRAAATTHRGHIRSGGVDRNVTFVNETDPRLNEQIDAAYQTKYGRYGRAYVAPMVARPARATTLKLVPEAEPRRAGAAP